jgi:putative oxidoreductase
MTKVFRELRGFALLPMRIVIGYGFFAHGVAKLHRGPVHFVSVLHALGVPFAETMAWLTILLEVIGGLLMLAGFLVPLVALPMLAILTVALVTVHAQFGFSSIKLLGVTSSGPRFGPPGMETDLLYIAGIAALVLGGPGPFAIDNWLRRNFARGRALAKASRRDS